ncbi:MAG TPA: ABC transporter permease [Streptosporangiaceae bacterium]
MTSELRDAARPSADDEDGGAEVGRGRAALNFLRGSSYVATSVRLLIVLIAISVGFGIAQPAFFSSASITNIFVSAVLVLLLALGETYVMISGGIDLSVAGMLALSGMVAGQIMSSLYTGSGSQWGVTLLGLLAALATGLAGGALNGLAISRLRLNSLIVTLGTMGVFTGVASLISNGNPITNFPAAAFTLGDGKWGPVPIMVAIAAGAVVVYAFVTSQTRFGRHIFAAGANREALRRAGVSVPLVTIGVFCMAGLVAGLAGFLDTAHFLTASPTAGSQDLLLAVAAVVIGGTPLEGGEGSIIGTVIGALIISVLQNGFVILNVQAYWQLVAVGVVTVGAVYAGERERIARVLKGA